jgi:endoglucanase
LRTGFLKVIAEGPNVQVFFTEKDITYIHKAGFDHIRLPIDEEQMWAVDGSREAEAFFLMGDLYGLVQ